MRWMKTALMTALAAALVAYIFVERSRQREQQKIEERALSLFDGFKLEDLTGATLVKCLRDDHPQQGLRGLLADASAGPLRR